MPVIFGVNTLELFPDHQTANKQVEYVIKYILQDFMYTHQNLQRFYSS